MVLIPHRILFSQTVLLALFLLSSGCFSGGPVAEHTQDSWVPHPVALLRAAPFPDLTVEIDHVTGYRPSALALQALETTIKTSVAKSKIHYKPMQELPRQESPYSDEDLARINAKWSDAPARRSTGANGTAFLHIVYLNGVLANESRIAQYGPGETMFIFLDDLTGLPGPVQPKPAPANVNRDENERATLIHELGHAFGLVGCGIPVVADRGHSDCHSHSKNSVMFAGVHDSTPSLTEPAPTPVWRFDSHDVKDLEHFRSAR